MRYPSTLQYLETITNSIGLFKRLKNIKPILDTQGYPIFSSGNFGTVFKVEIDGETRALKCFTRHQKGRSSAYERISKEIPKSMYFINYQYLDQEIYSFDDNVSGRYYSVVVMEWVEGETLTCHIEKSLHTKSNELMVSLLKRFEKMSDWLLQQTFAHNDLKPDNIMVRSCDGELVLIDYDGMFVESMEGEISREYGTEPFQSSGRAAAQFDRHVDNYSIAYIKHALQVLVNNPERYSSTSLIDFSPSELHEIEQVQSQYISKLQYLEDSFEGIRVFKQNELYGFLNENGELISLPIYERVRNFSEDNLAAVCQNEKWGFIDLGGIEVIALEYSDCTDFSCGFAAVKKGEKWFFIDKTGIRLSRAKFDNAWTPRFGLALVQREDKYGYAGDDGKLAIGMKYDFAQNFTTEEVACVMVDQMYGYIDKAGGWWRTPQYDFAQNFRDGKASVELDGKKKTVIFG